MPDPLTRPKWQRARIVRQPKHPEDIGKLLWTCGKYRGLCLTIGDDKLINNADTLMTNLVYSDGRPVAYFRDLVELLARGPEDFSDDIPKMNWDDWYDA